MSGRAHHAGRGPAALTTPASPRLQWHLIARGASRGFTVLLLGGVVQPLVQAADDVVGYWWLAFVAVAAFAVAAWSATAAPGAAVALGSNGAVAALGSYLLVLPLVLSAAGQAPLAQIGGTATTALVVGTATALLRGRRLHPTTPKG